MRVSSDESPGMIAVTTVGCGTPEVVRVPATDLYTFPDALPGLEDSHRYALIAKSEAAPFRWLQSLDETPVCLPVLGLDAVELHEYMRDVADVVGASEDSLQGSVLLVTRFDAAQATFLINLLAPIVLDTRQGTGRQIILDDRGYALRQPVRWDAGTLQFRLPC